MKRDAAKYYSIGVIFLILISLFNYGIIKADIFQPPLGDNLRVLFVSPTPQTNQSGNSIYVNLSSTDEGQHYSFIDFDKDLILWMRMDDLDSSRNPIDLSSYGNNGSLISYPIINSTFGKFGNGTGFDGKDDYINISDSSSISSVISKNRITLCVWIKPYSNTNGIDTGTNMGVMGKWWAAGNKSYNNRSFGMMRNGGQAGNKYSFHISADGITNDYSITDSDITLNQWSHLCGVFNGTSVLLYLNSQMQTRIGARTGIFNSSRTPLQIGTYLYSSNNSLDSNIFFNGSIDDILIWNRALSSQEIKALYNASANQYYNNFTNLTNATHNFTGYAVDLNGYANSTGMRSIGIGNFSTSDTTGPVFTNLANQTILENQSLTYDIDASDSSGVSCYRVNDTNNFNINCSGYLKNLTGLSIGIYWLNISVNDTLNNVNSEIIYVNVTNSSIPGQVPNITLISPTYQENTFSIEINTSSPASLCWFSINEGLTNVTMLEEGPQNFYYETFAYGTPNIHFYCQNQYGIATLERNLDFRRVVNFEDVYYTNSQGLKIYFDLNFNYSASNGKAVIIPDSWTAIKDTTWVWDAEKLYMNQGYVSIAINTRGKGLSQGVKDAFGWECLDIYELVQTLKTNSLYNQYINTSAFYISGASGAGGKAGVCTSKYPDTFAAGFSSVGVLNLTRWWYTAGSADVSEMEVRVGCGADECPEAYLTRDASSLNFNTATPMLVISNTNDDRVSVNCSRDYNHSMILYNKTTNFTEYPTGAHTIYRFEDSFSWFSKYNSEVFIPSSGILRIGGYVHTKNFSIYFGNVSKYGEVSYDISTNVKYLNISTSTYNGTANISLFGLNTNTQYIISSGFIENNQTSSTAGNINFSQNITNSSILLLKIYPRGDYCGDGTCNNEETCSSCSSDCGICSSSPPASNGGGGGGGGSSGNISVSVQGKMEISRIENFVARAGDKKTLSLKVRNNGKSFLNNCRLIGNEQINSWIYSSKIQGIAPGENANFVFNINIPEEIDSGDYNGVIEIICDEASSSSSIIISIPKTLSSLKIKEIKQDKNKLNINYQLESKDIKDTNIEIWMVDKDKNEIGRVKDSFKTQKGINERKIVMNLPEDAIGIYSIYFAISPDLEKFIKQSIVIGKTSTTGLSVLDTTRGKVVAFIIFILMLLAGLFLIIRENMKPKKEKIIHIDNKLINKRGSFNFEDTNIDNNNSDLNKSF